MGTVVFVRDKAYFCPRIFDDAVMYEVAEEEVFEFIELGQMRK